MKKHVFFDTNSRHDEIYQILDLEITSRNLAEGDLVSAYMEGEEWDAKIVRHGDRWGIVLLSEARQIPAERYEGQQEGFREGMILQKSRALRVLESLELPEDLLEEAKCRLALV